MFGFLPAPCSVCDGKTHDTYRGYFCGLSTRLARDYGNWARFLTNRDSTFVSVLASSQSDAPPESAMLTCCNPMGKKRAMLASGDHASYAAAVTICGAWAKLEDDRDDETKGRRALAKMTMPLLESKMDRAAAILNGLGFPVSDVRNELASQSERESAAGDCWETVSAPTAFSFGKIFRHSVEVEDGDFYEKAGASLGRIVYLMDAVEDQREDDANGRFNPLSVARSGIGEVRNWVFKEVDLLQEAVAMMSPVRHAGLIDFVLVEGVRERVESTLAEGGLGTGNMRFSKRRKSREKRSCWDNCDIPCSCDYLPCCRSGSKADCCDVPDCCPCDCG